MITEAGSRDSVGILKDLVTGDAIRYGDPISFSGLTVVPVFTSRTAPLRYVLVADAVASGVVTVEEVGGGRVPALRVVNRGALPVLLVDGEHLIGVKQNRVLNTTILVPEKSSLDVPVSCVEAGRWSSPLHEARPASPALFVGARARKAERVTASVRATGTHLADQHEIWDDVATMMGALSAYSPTAAMHGAYASRDAELGEFVKHLPCRAGQTGAVVAVWGRIVCADVFDHAETLAGLWDRLVPSHAVEALAKQDPDRYGPDVRGPDVTVNDAAAFLRSALDARLTEHPAVGRGRDLRLTGAGLAGAALEVDGTILHLALFRMDVPRNASSDVRFATLEQRRRRVV
jgi:hypothetical protein